MAEPVQLQTIPLGGTDYAGQPLPAQGQFLAPAEGQAVPGGSPWAAWAPPQPAGGPSEPGTPEASVAGPWAAYTPPEPKGKPAREVGLGEAGARGALDAITFGAAPAIAGLSEASGIEAPKEVEGALNKPAGVEILKPFIGAAKMLREAFAEHPDEAVQEAYNRGRESVLQDQKLAQEQHPYAYLAGQVGGSLLGLPATGGLPGGATTLARIGRAARTGAIGGGLYGGGEAASEGGDLADIGKGAAGGAAVGGVLGGGLGSTIEGATGIGRKVASIVRGARDQEGEAGSRVLSSLTADKKVLERKAADTEALAAGTEAGTPVYNVDFGGEHSRALLRSAANISPEARNTINEKLGSRYAQQSERFFNWIRSRYGADKDADIEAIKQLARKENAPAYQRAYAEGDHQIWTPELERLTSAPYIQAAIGDAIGKWKNYAIRDGFGAVNPAFRIENGGLIKTGSGLKAFPNLQLWDYAARELQDRAREAPPGSQAAGLFNDLARLLKDELDRQVPSYKVAREGAAAFFKAKDAVEAGANYVKDGTISTTQGARAVAKMTPAERELFRRGFAAELANQIERTGYRSDIIGSLFVSSDRAVRRTRVALGTEGAAQFESFVRVEKMVNEARLALGNSTTIRQGHEAGMAAGTIGLLETLHGALNPAYIIAGGLVIGGRQAARHIDERMALKIAEMLLSDNPAVLAKGYKIVSDSPVIRDALRAGSDVGVRQIINYMRPSGVAAGALALADHFRPSEIEHPSKHIQNDYPDYQGQQGAGPPF